jgi:hypothetical protein
MARWGIWAASAIGAAGAGAALALVRRRRPAEEEQWGRSGAFGVTEPGDPPEAAPPPGSEDPQEALDAARERLRARADALRDQIERDGETRPPGE